MLIGIAGKIASGKTTTAKILEEHFKNKGCKVFTTSLSTILRDVLTGESLKYSNVSLEWQNKSFERSNLIEFGKELKKQYGNKILVELAIQKSKYLLKNKNGITIIDGVRTIPEGKSILEHNGILLYINTDEKLRFERLRIRNDEKDKNIKTIEDLRKFDEIEEKMYKVSKLKEMSIIIENDGTLKELKERLVKIIESI